jgi:hypothetical protein
MRLNADGKNRLEAMKKALAAGLPLAGLLAGTVLVGAATEAAAVPGQMLGAPIPRSEVRRVEPPVEKPVEKLAEQSASAATNTTGTEASHRWTVPGSIPGPDEPPPPPPPAVP